MELMLNLKKIQAYDNFNQTQLNDLISNKMFENIKFIILFENKASAKLISEN